MKELTQTNLHELPEAEVVRLLESDQASGLTQVEVEARLQQFGRNEMSAQKRMSEWMRFLLQFAQPLMCILLLASGVTILLGEYVDSAVILGVTFINAFVGFFQESKAEKAIEALGSTTVICSDKTGTHTENQITVQQVFAGGRFFDVTGSGYEPNGAVLADGQGAALDRHEALRETLMAGLLNNDSRLVRAGDRLKTEGDPTEAALIVAAESHGAHPRLDGIAFESEHQFMATLHSRGEGQGRVIFKKGSLERLLERCSQALRDDGELAPLDIGAVNAAVEQMAAKGLRVLAFARLEVATVHHEHVREGLASR